MGCKTCMCHWSRYKVCAGHLAQVNHIVVVFNLLSAHHTDRWQHHAMYVGLRLPQHHRRRHHRRHHERGGGSSGSSAARKMGQQQDPPRDKNIEKVGGSFASERGSLQGSHQGWGKF